MVFARCYTPLMLRLVFLIVLLATSTFAQSNPSIEQAKTLFRAGEQAFEAGLYGDAAEAFEQAYVAYPVPELSFAIAQSHRKQYVLDGDLSRARRAVQRYREYLRTNKDGKRKGESVDYIGQLEPLLVNVSAKKVAPKKAKTQFLVSTTPNLIEGAVVSIDGGAKQKVPSAPEISAGKHHIHVSAPGYVPQWFERVAVKGRIIPVEVELKPIPAEIQLQAAGGSAIFADGQRVKTSNGKFKVLPGPRQFTVVKKGREAWTSSMRLEKGGNVTLRAKQPLTGQRKTSYWLMGAGSVALIGAGIYGGASFLQYQKAKEIDDKRLTSSISAAELRAYDGHRSKFLSRRNTGLWVATGGVALLSVGVVLAISETTKRPDSLGGFSPVVGSDGALGMSFGGSL